MPDHARVHRELLRAGSEVRESLPSAWRWRTGGRIRFGLPVDRDEWPDLEAALRRLAADANALADGESDVGSLSFADYLERLATTESVQDFLLGWWAVTGGSEPSNGAAIDGLAAIADHGGLLGIPDMLRRSPALGWGAIANSMAAYARAPVHYRRELVRVQHGEAITLHLAGGERVVAKAAILALPLNVLSEITFVPALPDRLRSSFGKNRGRAVKGLAAGTRRAARLVGSGPWTGAQPVARRPWRRRRSARRRLRPGRSAFSTRRTVEVSRRRCTPSIPRPRWSPSDSHDWNADPFARGTWATAPVGDIGTLDHARLRPVGRLAFASSDFAPHAAGWIEGAMASGEMAAAAIAAAVLSRADGLDSREARLTRRCPTDISRPRAKMAVQNVRSASGDANADST